MKNYSPLIAAQRLVRNKVAHGISRRLHPNLAVGLVTSVMTEKAHVQTLTLYARWLHLKRTGKHLKNSTPEDAKTYLAERAMTCRQKTIDLDRQAITLHLHADNPIQKVRSAVPASAPTKAYTDRQVALMLEYANADLGLSISLVNDAGLSSIELVTMSPINLLLPRTRNWSRDRFKGRQHGVVLCVAGRLGFAREVCVSQALVDQLKSRQRPQPERVSNRGAHLMSNFDLVGGHAFSLAFSKLSKEVLGFSHGTQGLRHTFAQRRQLELLCCGVSAKDSVKVVGQELGHFSTGNTQAYLNG